MKPLLNIILLFKRLGLILRLLGVGICFFILAEAIPDLIFNFIVKNVPTFTEEQIVKADKTKLPRYLKISDVEPIGEMYVEQLRYKKKNNDTTLTAIVYPVYSLTKKFENIEELRNPHCYIVVKDPNVTKSTIKNYFDQEVPIEGKYDQSIIDSETKKLLINAGYNIDDNCILISKGSTAWGIGKSLIFISLFGILGILIILSLLPTSALYKIFKQEQRFVRIK